MKAKPILIPLLALALAACDKAKEIAEKASSAVKQELAAKVGVDETEKVDEALAKLVDQTEEGIIFRKDLPFPRHLDVTITSRRKISVRFVHSSAIEKRAEPVNGTELTVTRLERNGDQIRYSLEQSSFSVPSIDNPGGELRKVANPLDQVAPTIRPITFRRNDGVWQSDGRDGLRAAVISKQLAPVLDELLIENALAAPPLWFGKSRIKVGSRVDVAGETISMLVAGDAKGSLHLMLESIEPVDGHPCGVFSVVGDYSRKQFPDFEGNLTDQDVTIESGKLWLSLLYPVVLKEELNTIQSFRSGGGGGLSGHGQGAVEISVSREWKMLPP